MDEQRIATIVEQVLSQLKAELPRTTTDTGSHFQTGRHGLFTSVDDAVQAAQVAHETFAPMGLQMRYKAVQAMRDVTLSNLKKLALMAYEETGLGRVEDKIAKNRLAAEKTPGPELLVPKAFSGDNGLCLTERAPYGVICSITPCTNPSETVLNNGICMISGGNSVVINPHPSAKGITAKYIQMLNQAMVAVGAPDNLISAVLEPTIESAGALMKHPGVALVVVTGGPAVVRAAMATGKKCIAAGPGNPPVVVDETANLTRAAQDIITGAGMDNNIICIVEKEIIAVDAIADRLKQELVRAGAYLVKDAQVGRLVNLLVEDGHIVKRFVGKNVSEILREIGVRVSDDVRIAFFETDESNPLVQLEQLLPVIPMVRARTCDDAIAMALRVEHGFRHTAVMHSLNIENMHRFARAANTSIFIKNAPSLAGLGFGGEGYTSWTIASPTGEGLTTAVHFTRERRCTLKEYFRIV